MKRLVLTALAAAFAAIAHADNEAVGTPLAMPAEMQEAFARNPATASNNERFANAEAAAVYQAAHDGDLARARQILAQRPDILQSHNTQEMTPLGVAMMSGDRKAFNALLDLGADPTWLGDMRDTDLHLAAILTDRYWLDALIKRGVNLEIPNTLGETPLFAALGAETRGNFELLLKAGADIHARRTADGETLLHKASAISDYAAVPRLLKLGVDPTLRDHVGYTFQYSYFLASDNPPHAKEVRAWLDAHNIPIDTSRIAPDAPPADNSLCTVPPTALLTAVSPHYRASAALLQNSGKDNAARPADEAAADAAARDVEWLAKLRVCRGLRRRGGFGWDDPRLLPSATPTLTAWRNSSPPPTRQKTARSNNKTIANITCSTATTAKTCKPSPGRLPPTPSAATTPGAAQTATMTPWTEPTTASSPNTGSRRAT